METVCTIFAASCFYKSSGQRFLIIPFGRSLRLFFEIGIYRYIIFIGSRVYYISAQSIKAIKICEYNRKIQKIK